VLHGVRGDDSGAVERVAGRIESEPVADAETFLTNQGTDAHVRPGAVGGLTDGRAYRVDGVVARVPETRRGGHVFFAVAPPADVDAGGDGDGAGAGRPSDDATGDGVTLECAAFEPTKRFRDRVRALRTDDRLTLVGEVADGTLKLEKFAVRELNDVRYVTPTCPRCGRSMESTGREQGYRCRECRTSTGEKVPEAVERSLEEGWYEVPPVARRHVARPLVRGGFDAPVHPER
jgi:tRNA(Ile2)-agmatinylcytidine synthase